MDDIQIPSDTPRKSLQFQLYIEDPDDPFLSLKVGWLGYFCPDTTAMIQIYMIAWLNSLFLSSIQPDHLDFKVFIQMELIIYGNFKPEPCVMPLFTHECPS